MDKSIFHKITYGLYIITTKAKDKLAGCVVNTVFQITSEDSIFAISINKENYTNIVLKESKKVVINVLSRNIKSDIIKVFGFLSSKDVNKFDNINYENIDNLPVLTEGSCGYIIGEVINIISLSTHEIFLIKVTKTHNIENDIPLTYEYYQTNMKGISPKKAPTYIDNTLNNSRGKVYRCTICGHLYKDDEEKIKFEDLDDNWVCPICGVGKDKFELIS